MVQITDDYNLAPTALKMLRIIRRSKKHNHILIKRMGSANEVVCMMLKSGKYVSRKNENGPYELSILSMDILKYHRNLMFKACYPHLVSTAALVISIFALLKR